MSMHSLIKYFAKEEYRKQFVAGKLYMNTIDYFWNNGFDDQRDVFEGIVCTVPVKDFEGFEPDFQVVQATDYRFRAIGYKYCNVCCFYRLDYEYNERYIRYNHDPQMIEFGEYAALITDKEEFMRRIDRAIKRGNFKYLCGKVHYRVPEKDGIPVKRGPTIDLETKDFYFSLQELIDRGYRISRRDCFDKDIRYGRQQEWRIALYRGKKETHPYCLEVGNLSDIVQCFHASEFTKAIDYYLDSNNLESISTFDGWYGNIERKKMRELFYELGENKTVLMATIG